MQRSQLFKLLTAVRGFLGDDLPIIVGSQAIHAVTANPPEVALESVECDFLVIGGRGEARERINKELGVFSSYQKEEGFYADALGLATVIVPTGWADRLKPLVDDEGNLVANCVEIHDVVISKLVAGREKDFEFLTDAFDRGLISITEFVDRLPWFSRKLRTTQSNTV